MPFKICHDFFVLLGRNFRVLKADLLGVMLTMCLSPLIAFLVIVAFWQIYRDAENNDNLVLSAQLLFDTVHILQREQPMEKEDSAPALPSYPASTADQAYADFAADYCLWQWLGAEVANRGETRLEDCARQAEEMWKMYGQMSIGSFVPDFTLFRYRLANDETDQFAWPSGRYVLIDQYEVPDNPPVWWPKDAVTGASLIPLKLLEKRCEAMHRHRQNLCGEETARLLMTVFFILIAAAIWMGLLPGCREIVSEWEVFQWENRVLYSRVAYIGAKFTMLGVITAIQDMLLMILVGKIWQNFSWNYVLAMYLVLWLASLSAIALSLLVSSCSTTLRAALTLAPIIMIAQVIEGGLLRLPAQDSDTSKLRPWRHVIQRSTQQFWGFEAMIGLVARLDKPPPDYSSGLLDCRVVTKLIKPESHLEVTHRQALNSFLECQEVRLDDYVFGSGTFSPPYGKNIRKYVGNLLVRYGLFSREALSGCAYHVVRPILHLLGHCLELLLLASVCLKARQFFSTQGGRVVGWIRRQ